MLLYLLYFVLTIFNKSTPPPKFGQNVAKAK